jgi:signal peptidase I
MSSALPIESSAARPRRVAVPAVLRSLSPRLVLAVFALALVGLAIGYLGSWPPLATVMSGSMAPTIKTGDVVVFKRLDGLPHRGDIVDVSVPAKARARYGYPPEVVHRVVRIAADGKITTKGDARPHDDPFTVTRADVNAKVVAHIPAAGRVIAFLMSPMGLLWIAGGAVMLFVLPFLDRRQEMEQAERDALADMRDELQRMSDELVRLRTEPVVILREPEPVAPEPEAVAPEPEPVAEPAPVVAPPAPAGYAVRRRSGGLLGRFR